MKSAPRSARAVRRCLPAMLLAAPLGALALPAMTFSSYPLFLSSAAKSNVMIVLDNSQSMDGTMSGKVISGDDPATRGNIVRGVLRSVLQTYRDSFNWGLATFETKGTKLYNTHANYVGNATTMAYTNDCVRGVSSSNGGRRCIANPDAAVNGYGYLTYDRSGDDADINDVLYSDSTLPVMYGVGDTGAKYFVRGGPRRAGTGWTVNDFPVPGPFGGGSTTFSPTDAGWVPQAATMPRQLWLQRGWGYNSDISGVGKIVEEVMVDSGAHFNNLLTLLGNETNGATGEIKNSAIYTPLAGSLASVKKYFGEKDHTPITQACQRNFVVMATDGNPTGKTDGKQYDPSAWATTYNAATAAWTYGQAQQDVFAQLTALRSTLVGSTNYDIRTYVVGMGDTVANPGSIAALNQMARLGGGYATAFLGSDTAALTQAFQAIVGDIQSKASAAAAVALNGGSWSTGSVLYQAKFDSADWSGNLVAYPVNATGAVASASTWNAAAQVKSQNWDTGRRIVTYKPSALPGSRGIAFRWPVVPATPKATELDASQVAALNLNAAGTSDGYGSARLRFLRGDAGSEARSCATPPCAAPQFRNRNATPLGDIVNSSPYYVSAPSFGYYDDMESAPYSSFASTYRTRTPMIYVGANDGMLHAINASTGAEALAYVPSMLYSSLSQLTDLNYSHRYFADGSPTVGDVFYAGAWHTLLASGLRTGGKGLFALDVTNPANFAESNAASIVRWEFQDADMGHVFGQPLLVKTNNGRWSVIVGGGYNHGNATGRAFLFVIDAETGALTRKIDTGAGTSASPNGLSAPAAIDVNGDEVVDAVYAGDLNGNLWKFDIGSATAASWTLGNGGLPLFTAASQSITSRPDVTRFPGGGYLIAFGTGRYAAIGDPTDATVQTEYGIRDTLVNGTVTLAQLQQQSVLATTTGPDGNDYRLATHAVGAPSDPARAGDNAITRATYLSTKKGWYLNLPSTGERVVAEARLRGGRVVMTSLIPDVSSSCTYGGSGWVMEYDAITGNRLNTPTFDTNGDNSLSDDDYLSFPGDGTARHNTSGRRIAALPAAPGFMGHGRGIEDKYLNTSEGNIVRVRETAAKGGEGRVMWREVR